MPAGESDHEREASAIAAIVEEWRLRGVDLEGNSLSAVNMQLHVLLW